MYNPLCLADFYKVGHPEQCPPGITWAASSWIPRRSRLQHTNQVVVFSNNYTCKEYLQKGFSQEFFGRPQRAVIDEYRAIQHDCLHIDNPNPQHIRDLHNLGYLPLKIQALPEGSVTETGVPHGVISSTHANFAWLPQYIESLYSNVQWMPSTNASTARRYRQIMTKWARYSGEKDLSFIDWQGHDFSYRGLAGTEAAMLSGMGHLLSFSGTDTIPAILAARDYYGAPLSVGGSVPATEHWVMCAWIAAMADGEFEAYRTLLEKYIRGPVSIVSDTFDLWNVLTRILPRLQGDVLKRDGNLVVRPDSGNPADILCGDAAYEHVHGSPQAAGVLHLMAQCLGTITRDFGLPLINHGGAIYGDSITEERCDDILGRIVQKLKLSPFNQVFGIGSYTYQYVTRDTFGWKLAPAAMMFRGKLVPLEKKPITDDGTKHSYRGLVTVSGDGPIYYRKDVRDNQSIQALNSCAYQTIFEDGNLPIDPKFQDIRDRLRSTI